MHHNQPIDPTPLNAQLRESLVGAYIRRAEDAAWLGPVARVVWLQEPDSGRWDWHAVLDADSPTDRAVALSAITDTRRTPPAPPLAQPIPDVINELVMPDMGAVALAPRAPAGFREVKFDWQDPTTPVPEGTTPWNPPPPADAPWDPTPSGAAPASLYANTVLEINYRTMATKARIDADADPVNGDCEWTETPPASDTRVHYGVAAPTPDVSGSPKSAVLDHLVPDTDYAFDLRYHKQDGDRHSHGASTRVSVHTQPLPKPVAKPVTNLTEIVDSTVGNGLNAWTPYSALDINWEVPVFDDKDLYVLIEEVVGGAKQLVAKVRANDRGGKFTHAGLAQASQHTYTLRYFYDAVAEATATDVSTLDPGPCYGPYIDAVVSGTTKFVPKAPAFTTVPCETHKDANPNNKHTPYHDLVTTWTNTAYEEGSTAVIAGLELVIECGSGGTHYVNPLSANDDHMQDLTPGGSYRFTLYYRVRTNTAITGSHNEQLGIQTAPLPALPTPIVSIAIDDPEPQHSTTSVTVNILPVNPAMVPIYHGSALPYTIEANFNGGSYSPRGQLSGSTVSWQLTVDTGTRVDIQAYLEYMDPWLGLRKGIAGGAVVTAPNQDVQPPTGGEFGTGGTGSAGSDDTDKAWFDLGIVAADQRMVIVGWPYHDQSTRRVYFYGAAGQGGKVDITGLSPGESYKFQAYAVQAERAPAGNTPPEPNTPNISSPLGPESTVVTKPLSLATVTVAHVQDFYIRLAWEPGQAGLPQNEDGLRARIGFALDEAPHVGLTEAEGVLSYNGDDVYTTITSAYCSAGADVDPGREFNTWGSVLSVVGAPTCRVDNLLPDAHYYFAVQAVAENLFSPGVFNINKTGIKRVYENAKTAVHTSYGWEPWSTKEVALYDLDFYWNSVQHESGDHWYVSQFIVTRPWPDDAGATPSWVHPGWYATVFGFQAEFESPDHLQHGAHLGDEAWWRNHAGTPEFPYGFVKYHQGKGSDGSEMPTDVFYWDWNDPGWMKSCMFSRYRGTVNPR